MRTYMKNRWSVGERAWFEYHCLESHDSTDAHLWYRSHQRVTVIGGPDGSCVDEDMTFRQRGEEGVPNIYRVRFVDGLEADVFEDELTTSRRAWYRPNPPKATTEVERGPELVT